MEHRAAVEKAERISRLFIAVVEKLVTEKALGAMGDDSITHAQMAALRFLAGCKSPLMGDVAQGLRISLPAATKAIDRLVRKGLALREEDLADRRVVRITLTAKGRDMLRDVCDRQTSAMADIIENMQGSHMEGFITGIENFVRSAMTDEVAVESVCLHCGESHQDDCIVNGELARLRRESEVDANSVLTPITDTAFLTVGSAG